MTIRLSAGQFVKGRVLDAAGRALENVKVKASLTERSGGDLEGLTEADGSFKVEGLGDADYSLDVEPPYGFLAPPTLAVRGGAHGIEIRLERGKRPTLRVVDGSGAPVPGARVEIEPVHDPLASSHTVTHTHSLGSGRPEAPPTTQRDGTFRLPTLDTNVPVQLRVTPGADRADLAEFRSASWMPGDATITLPAGFVLRGRVEDQAGRPVAEQDVEVSWQGDPMPATLGRSESLSAKTDEDGRFVIRAVPARAVRVAVDVGEHVDVEAGPESRDVRLIVPLQGYLRVLVENAPPLGGERFRVRLTYGTLDTVQSTRYATPDKEGRATFEGLSLENTYALCVGPTDDARVAYLPKVRPMDGDVHVRLLPGKRITGRILAPADATDVEVRVLDGPVDWDGVVHADGRFEITGVPEGRWSVRAGATSGGRRLYGFARVAAGGSADIDLRR